MANVIPGVEIVVPRCFILATSVFDEFMDTNGLISPALNAKTDAEVEELFNKAALPAYVVEQLQSYLETTLGRWVRSSSSSRMPSCSHSPVSIRRRCCQTRRLSPSSSGSMI